MTETPPKRRPGRPSRTGDGETSQRNVRIPDDLWRNFGAAAEAAGLNRTELINLYAAWFVREPGAKLPVRPERTDP